jgi:quinol monooxygenase YgiN
MITEIATVTIAPDHEAAFEAAMREGGGLAALCACPGVLTARFGRGVESPDTFAFVVEWESLAAHDAARSTNSFAAFRAAMGTMTIGGAMAHYVLS